MQLRCGFFLASHFPSFIRVVLVTGELWNFNVWELSTTPSNQLSSAQALTRCQAKLNSDTIYLEAATDPTS